MYENQSPWQARKRLLSKRFRRQGIKRKVANLNNKIARSNALSAKRRAAELRATPKWSLPDKLAIEAIYSECQRISQETGIIHHVDHIVPLRGKLVCGLHVSWNLQILTAFDNLSKGNRHQVHGESLPASTITNHHPKVGR